MKDAEYSLVDNLIAEKLILPTFRPDAPVLLRARGGLEHPVSLLGLLRFLHCTVFSATQMACMPMPICCDGSAHQC